MSLLDEFEQASRPSRPRCPVAATLLDLDAGGKSGKERAEKLRAALDATHITGAAIEKVVGTWGFALKQLGVQRHRRGDCSCGS